MQPKACGSEPVRARGTRQDATNPRSRLPKAGNTVRYEGPDRPPSTTITRTSEACPPRALLKLNRTCPQHAPTAPLVCGEHTFSASRDAIADSVPCPRTAAGLVVGGRRVKV